MKMQTIEWQEIHEHLNQSKRIINNGFFYSDEEIRTLLRQRAHELAKESTHSTEKENSVNMIEFALGDEHYGIESAYVSRVCKSINITRLPCTPVFVEGIINVHGNVVCVINLKEFFKLPKTGNQDTKRVLIINNNDVKLGILVDSVSGIESICLDTMQTSLTALTGVRSELLKGITHDQRIILDAPKLVACEEFIINDTV